MKRRCGFNNYRGGGVRRLERNRIYIFIRVFLYKVLMNSAEKDVSFAMFIVSLSYKVPAHGEFEIILSLGIIYIITQSRL